MALSIMFWTNYVSESKKLQRRSELSVRSNHVLTFTFDQELNVIQSSVQASFKDKSYRVTIELESDAILKSSCGCPNGQEKCHHVAAVLLYGYQNVSKTSIKQSWVKNPKSAPPKETATMEELFPPPAKLQNYRATNRDVDQEDISFLFDKLTNLGRFSAMHWMLSPEPAQPVHHVPLIEDLLIEEDFLKSTDQSKWLKEKLATDDSTVRKVADITVGQRNNCLWSSIRKYRLTASNFGAILSAIKRNRFPPSLFKRLCGAYNLEKKDAIIWGVANESVAFDKYSSEAVVESTGLWLHTSGVLGASPDGVIKSPSQNFFCQTPNFPKDLKAEILEIKCPFAAREMTLHEAILNLPNFYIEYSPGLQTMRLKEDHDYYHQIQGQLYCTDKNVCDLIVWTPKDSVVIRIMRDPLWISNINKLIDFYFSNFIQYIKN